MRGQSRHNSVDGQRKWSEGDVRRGGDIVVSRGPKHVAVISVPGSPHTARQSFGVTV